jgi:serine/threonine-protein kinase
VFGYYRGGMPGSAVSDLAGRVLAGRYLLHGAIGTGASGRVYAAEDTRLRRRVAVKVLHAALAEDAAFLRRFRAEAQLAASLHHPHIVTVHDWGEDEVPFMVLELLEGGSLRSMLDQGELLTVAQTARISRDVASALEYAHARGVLHRDIKPANLLFDEHGIVRVADFGLARALAEASWTEPAGAVFGTARYASPEQASGVQLDARSDLYSLALVMVEAVTGRIPFAADTTLGTLTARTTRPLLAPEELGPLGAVVDRAGAIEPADRYPDAATMRQAIADAGDALPPPAPLVLAGMVDRADPNPTRAVPERSAPLFDQDAVEIVRAAPAPVEATLVVETETEKDRRRRTGQRRLVPLVVAIVVLVTVALAAAALAQVQSAPPVRIPGFIGLNVQDAQAAATKAGFQWKVGATRSSPDPPGTVIDQNPPGGTFSGNHTVSFIVSAGPAKVAVPNIVKMDWSAAQQALDAAGLVYSEKPKTRYDDVIPRSAVISVSPEPGEQVNPDSTVTVLLSSGRAPVPVPDVRNQSFADASKTLTDAQFKVKRAPNDEFDTDVAAGDVIRTEPAIGSPAKYGSEVTVVVSKGPDLVTVPDLRNLSFDNASQALDARGLLLTVNGKYKSGQLVSGQKPQPGTRVVKGSDVAVTFSKSNCLLDFICF